MATRIRTLLKTLLANKRSGLGSYHKISYVILDTQVEYLAHSRPDLSISLHFRKGIPNQTFSRSIYYSLPARRYQVDTNKVDLLARHVQSH